MCPNNLAGQQYNPGPSVQYRACTTGCAQLRQNDPLNSPFVYSGINDFTTSHFTSDFGFRRNCGACNIWHNGNDLSVFPKVGSSDPDRGYSLVAVTSGIITRLKADANYKFITTGPLPIGSINYNPKHKFGYGHIFRSGLPGDDPDGYFKSGKFILKECEPPHTGYYAIVDLEACKAYSDIANAIVKIDNLVPTFYCVANVFTTVNSIVAGEDIAPMGDASADNVHSHLHHYKNTSGTHTSNPNRPITNNADPLEVVRHLETNYSIELRTQNEAFGEINISYPGDEEQLFFNKRK